MIESIKKIFDHNIKLLGDIDRATYYFREQQYDKALSIVANSIDEIKLVIEAIISDHEYFNLVATESLLEMLTGFLNAKKNKDFILLADLLDLQLINFLIGVQELIISKEEMIFDEENYKENLSLMMNRGIGFSEEFQAPINTAELLERGYRVEFTSCGQMTLAAMNDGTKFYFHTNNLIQSEAFALARHWYLSEKSKYIIFGFGMGYHISEMLEIADNVEVEVYEPDLNVLQLACAFTDLKNLLLNDRLKLVYDPEGDKLKQRITDMNESEVFHIHYPSYKNIRSSENKQLLHAQLSWIETIEAL